MSSSQRLSELIGIEPRRSRDSVWPLNAVLVALGAVIIWIAFKFLQNDDPRFQYNPWSYAVATPVALIGISLLLRSITSRGVERSMQIAFLLSVLVHLIMSLYAGNVVIFTRMWPDIFEELAQERRMLERQSQPAPRYHNVASARSEKRPDYLRYVPTTHEPSEIEDASEEALQLATAHKTELVSPKPNVEKSATPHLIPREQSQLPPPQANDRIAALSRSEAKLSRPALSAPESLSPADLSASPEPVRPTETAAERGKSSGAALRNEFAEPAALDRSKPASTATIDRRDLVDQPQIADLQQNKPRSNRAAPPSRGNTIDVPDSATSKSDTSASSLAANERTVTDARTVRNSSASVAAPANSPALNPNISKNDKIARRADRNAETRVPSPSAGDMPSALARESAGGRSSPTAPRSMPIQGVDSIATPEASDTELNSSFSGLALRNSLIQRSTSGLPELGLPQSSNMSRSPSLSNGTSGSSNSVMPQRAGQGVASSQDIAGLTGSGQAIQKSAVGVAGRPRGR